MTNCHYTCGDRKEIRLEDKLRRFAGHIADAAAGMRDNAIREAELERLLW